MTPPPPGQTAGDGKGGEILGFSEGSVLWGQVSKGTTWWGKEITYRAYEEMQNEYMWGPDKSMIETSITGPIRTDCSPCKSCMRTCWYVYQVELKKTAYMDVYQKYTYGIINQTLEKYYDFVTGYYGTVPIGGVMTVGGGLVAAGLEAGAATGVTVGATGWAVYTIMTKEMQEHFHSERTVLGTGWKYLGQDKGYSKSLSKTEMKGESWAEKCP